MKKKILIPIILILIIIGIIAVIILTKGTEEKKLLKVYEKMLENQTYAFTRYDFEETNKYITYRKVDKTLIDMYISGEHMSTLIREGDMYLISHASKEYFIYQNNHTDENILTENLKDITSLEYVAGKEKIYGKTYKYEEYNGVSYFLISPEENIDMETIKTRFYFDGSNLVYLKTIYDTVNKETSKRETKEELQTIKVEYQVNDNVFEIPEEYAEY